MIRSYSRTATEKTIQNRQHTEKHNTVTVTNQMKHKGVYLIHIHIPYTYNQHYNGVTNTAHGPSKIP